MTLSRLVIIICAAVIIVVKVFSGYWKPFEGKAILTWDVFGYYLYLPATFIYKDPFLKEEKWRNELVEKYKPTIGFYQASKIENGNWVYKYPMGLAILFLPFFLLGHLFSSHFGFPPDGLSPPYQISIIFGTAVYSIVGLIYLRKVLLKYFDDKVTSLTIIVLFIGTNLFDAFTLSSGMPHNIMFTICAGVMYYTIRRQESGEMKYLIFSAILIGFGILCRSTAVFLIAIPFLWGQPVVNWIQIVKQPFLKPRELLVFFGTLILIISVQHIYWWYITGKFFYSGYEESLDLLSPFFKEVLFSFKKGWLLYTPLMALALFGFIALYKLRRVLFWTVLLVSVFHIWIVCSWQTWWYGGSFSQRGFIDIYPLLAIPLTAVLHEIFNLKRVFRVVAYLGLSLLAFLNLFQHWQFYGGIISGDRMTAKYYKAVFLKSDVKPDDLELLEIGRAHNGVKPYLEPSQYKRLKVFDDDFSESGNHSVDSARCFLIKGPDGFSPAFEREFFLVTGRDHFWGKIRFKLYVKDTLSPPSIRTVFHFAHGKRIYGYESMEINSKNLKPGWNDIHYEYLSPAIIDESDYFKCYLWKNDAGEAIIDNFSVEIFEKK